MNYYFSGVSYSYNRLRLTAGKDGYTLLTLNQYSNVKVWVSRSERGYLLHIYNQYVGTKEYRLLDTGESLEIKGNISLLV